MSVDLRQMNAALAVAVSIAASPSFAQDNSADLAKQLSNPISSLISVPFQYNYDDGLAGGDGSREYVNVQPVIPFSIGEDWNLISRTIVPLTSVEGVPPGAGRTRGVGNVVQSLFFSPKAPTAGGLIWGVGPVFQLPTSTDDVLGPQQLGAGLTAVGLVQSNGWTLGALANHIWSVNKEDEYGESSATFLQPFVSYSTPRGTSVTLNTEATYDWINEEWSVPINLAVAQIVRISGQPMQLQAGARYWADSTPNGPSDWGARLGVTYMFPK
jgi:hypothetical protein